MAKEKRKTTNLNKEKIKDLPNDKPAVYKIIDDKGKNIYTGVAKRGRVRARVNEHLPGGPDPIRGGKKVIVQQKGTIDDAERSEHNIIKRSKPKFNKK